MTDKRLTIIICRALTYLFLLMVVVYIYPRRVIEYRRAGHTLSYQIIQGNSIKAPNVPPTIQLPQIFGDIIMAESSDNPTAKNPHSTATGLLQIIKSSQRFCESQTGYKMNMKDPDDNLYCGEILYKHFGLTPWESSRSKWNKN